MLPFAIQPYGLFMCLFCFSVKGRCSGSDVLNGIVAGPYNDVYYTACREGYKRFTKGWWATAECKNGKWSGLEDCIGKSS